MTRSPPPAAIDSSMAAAVMGFDTVKASDLPLRHFLEEGCGPRAELHDFPPTPPDSASCNPVSGDEKAAAEPDTPSSTIAEFGDETRRVETYVVDIAQQVYQAYTRSRSTAPSKYIYRDSASRSSTPTPRKSRSASRSHSSQRMESSTKGSAHDRVNRFLHSLSQSPALNPTEELLSENRSLHQRIAALQRTEQTLLKDTQDLSRRLTSAQQRYETRRQHWKDELRNRERDNEIRIRELEARIVQQDKELKLLQILNRPKDPPGPSDEVIASWFSARTNAWSAWAQEYSHPEPDRIQSGLHPLQQNELCNGVKDFVRLTEDQQLPIHSLLSAGVSGSQATQVLLNGMLANFMTSQIVGSPFWVFDLLSTNLMDLESPSVARPDSVSPIGFRMDLASVWSTVAPPRTAGLPPRVPVTRAASFSPESKSTPRQLPRLITSLQATSTLPGSKTVNLLEESLPSRKEVEGLYRLLLNVPGGNENAVLWRTRLMKAFTDGGICADVGAAKDDNARMLAEFRQRYAARLKDQFLRGAARFLLKDQDCAGIEALEQQLVHEIDLVLRFSCQLWSRPDAPRITGLPDIVDRLFNTSSESIEIHTAHFTAHSMRGGHEFSNLAASSSPHDRNSVIMVVQPAIEVGFVNKQREVFRSPTKVWSKAKVLAAPSNDENTSKSSAAVEQLMSPVPITAIPMTAIKTKPFPGLPDLPRFPPPVMPATEPTAGALLPSTAFHGLPLRPPKRPTSPKLEAVLALVAEPISVKITAQQLDPPAILNLGSSAGRLQG